MTIFYMPAFPFFTTSFSISLYFHYLKKKKEEEETMVEMWITYRNCTNGCA